MKRYDTLMRPLGIAVFIVITIACVQMHFFARPGLLSDTPLLDDRLAFMVANLGYWQLLWLNWMIAALGLLLFANMLTEFAPPSYLRRYAILVMALGIAPDLSGECIYAFILPLAYANQLGDANQLAVLEIIAMNLTGTVGNGFYNIGGLVLNSLLFANTKIPRWIIWSGIPAWVLGIGLSCATALAHYPAAELFTASAMAWSTLWILLVALTVFAKPVRYRFMDASASAQA